MSDDLRKFEDAPPGDVDAIEGYCLAFRREDFAARGPFDERFRFYRNLDIWWSLVLRDEGEGRAPRRAVALADLPPSRHEHRGYTSLPRRRTRPPEQAQLLPDHRPVRVAARPPRQPLTAAGAGSRSSSCCHTVMSGSRRPMASQAIGAASSVNRPVLNMTVLTASV